MAGIQVGYPHSVESVRILEHPEHPQQRFGVIHGSGLAGVDLGEDLRLEIERVSGAGLAWERELVQLSVFPRKAV